MFFNKTRRKLCTKVPLKIPSFSKTDKKRPEGVAVDNKGIDGSYLQTDMPFIHFLKHNVH